MNEMNERMEKAKKRKADRRRAEAILEWVLRILIRYPFILPAAAVKEWVDRRREVYWLSNMDLLLDRAIDEAVYRISTSMASDPDDYVVINQYDLDELEYANAFYVRTFLEQRYGRYGEKENRKARLYLSLSGRKAEEQGVAFDREAFFNGFYEELFRRMSEIPDLSLEKEEIGVWPKHECFYIRLKKGGKPDVAA